MGPLVIFPALAFLVLAAHFFREGRLAVGAACLLLLPLLFVPRRWAAFALQTGLIAGALVWMRAATALLAIRLGAGQPWIRLAVILGGVTLATAAGLLVFRSGRVKRFFRLED